MLLSEPVALDTDVSNASNCEVSPSFIASLYFSSCSVKSVVVRSSSPLTPSKFS